MFRNIHRVLIGAISTLFVASTWAQSAQGGHFLIPKQKQYVLVFRSSSKPDSATKPNCLKMEITQQDGPPSALSGCLMQVSEGAATTPAGALLALGTLVTGSVVSYVYASNPTLQAHAAEIGRWASSITSTPRNELINSAVWFPLAGALLKIIPMISQQNEKEGAEDTPPALTVDEATKQATRDSLGVHMAAAAQGAMYLFGKAENRSRDIRLKGRLERIAEQVRRLRERNAPTSISSDQ